MSHWLEGAEQQFVVLTDHKNLEYLKSGKRFNSRQAQWALFFNRFHFHLLAYCLSWKNCKVDALSRQFDSSEPDYNPEFILPPSSCLRVTCLSIENEVLAATGVHLLHLPVHLIACLFRTIYTPGSFSVVIHQNFPVILVSLAPITLSSRSFGGRPCPKISRSLSVPVPPVPSLNPQKAS